LRDVPVTLQRIVLHYRTCEPIRCIHGFAEGTGTLPGPQRVGNRSAERIARALGLLLSMGYARRKMQRTGGRRAERWFAA
jgi:hypothetical protein